MISPEQLEFFRENGLEPTIRTNADLTVDVIIRDTLRNCIHCWRVNSQSSTRMAVEIPLTDVSCNSIKTYFERMRQLHPQDYLTCECHKHVRQ